MTTALDAVALELYEQLTARTFYVVDTEFATHDGEHHLVSIAVIPVIGGRRTRAGAELYREMNPGVPIDDISRTIHGFTDEAVAGKCRFDHYANVIAGRLNEPDAIFVSHTTIDAHVVRREFERLTEGKAGAAIGIPLMPVINTQALASAAKYPGVGRSRTISLAKLCDLTGVTYPANAHHARDDARATADAFIELMRYIAAHAAFWTFDDLLTAAGGGTTHEPTGPSHIRAKAPRRRELPAEHVAKHVHPLLDPVPAGSDRAERWLDMAAECAQLRCPDLRDEATVAAHANSAILINALMDDLPHLTKPGEAGTLLGAIYEFLAVAGVAGLPMQALRWWKAARPKIKASTACDRSSAATMCPSCLEGQPCPRDIVHVPLAEIVTLGTEGNPLDAARADHITSPASRSPVNTWRKNHPDVLAYSLWRVAQWQFDEGLDEKAYSTVDLGIAMGLHTLDPRLTELACNRLIETGKEEDAFAVAESVLAERTTDPAYADLSDWVLFTQNALYAQQPAPRKPITYPRRARPEGHANPRLYS